MQVKPLSSRVLVRPTGAEETTKSGIVIPVTIEKEKPEQGEVVAVGEGRRNDKGELQPMSVKVGD
ncbi:MAG: 10 kDa chaperonin, partial [Candidatus Parcubacteria bacterium]